MSEEANSVWKLIKEVSRKKGITEILINDEQHVFVERQGKLIRLESDLTREHIDHFVAEVAEHNQIAADKFLVMDGLLPDKSRVNVVSSYLTEQGPVISIRRYQHSIRTFDTSPGIFGISPRWIKLLKAMVLSRANIIVAGGTSSGKTTLLNLLLQEVPQTERIITLEDTRELYFQLPNVVRLVPGVRGPTVRQLIKNTLRMRPDRIILGEVRGEEFFDLLQSMNTGHRGSMATVHANSPAETLNRLENLYLLAGHDVPQRAVRFELGRAIDYIVQVERGRDGQRRLVRVVEVTGVDDGVISLLDLGQWEGNELIFNGFVPQRIEDLTPFGITPALFTRREKA